MNTEINKSDIPNTSSEQTKRLQSAITLFGQMKNGGKYRLNGDKCATEINKMIINLFRHYMKIRDKFATVIIYDNRKTRAYGEDIVMKWEYGKLVIDKTPSYGIEDINMYNY